MTALGLLGAVVVVVLRVWLLPAQRDNDTGLFSGNVPVILLTLLMVVALAVLAVLVRKVPRKEIAGKSSLILAMVALAAGGAFLLTGVVDVWTALRPQVVPVEVTLSMRLLWVQRVFCLLSGAALVHLGLLLASENATRRGIAQWSMLAPVVWMWLVLANYEMSSASMVRLTNGYFTLMTYISELLFLFYFARYMAGVGKVGVGVMLLFSSSATLFALSGPVVKMITHLMQDSAAYEAAGVANNWGLDLAVGLLALTTAATLCHSLSSPSEDKAEEVGSIEAVPDTESVWEPDEFNEA